VHTSQEIIRIGCAGWNIPQQSAPDFDFEGTHLERYSRVFNCCEINSSFYRPHKDSTWERWSASVPTDFRFSVKVPRAITHEVELKCKTEDLTAFLKPVRLLGQRLGVLLVQLPPRCVFDYWIVKRFFALLRELHDGDVVLEARNATWFDARADDLQQQFSIAGVAVDPGCVPLPRNPLGISRWFTFVFTVHLDATTLLISREFLDARATQLADQARRARVWCIFDNTAAGFATSNALQLLKSAS
jgi:uncharacterized protein YecE (DUF72 family)